MKLLPRLSIGLASLAILVVAAAPDPAALVRRLADPSARSRDDAARELAAMGSDAAEALDAAAASDDPEVRTRATALLALVRDAAGIRVRAADSAVRDALRSKDGLAAGSASDRRLAETAPESSRALAALARRDSSHGFVPLPMASALARHATRESLAALAEAVRDERALPSTALVVAREIDAATAGDERLAAEVRDAAAPALEPLLVALRSHSPATRRAAAALLGALGGDAATARLVALADDPDAGVRTEVARSLGVHAPAESAKTLRALAADSDAHVRETALAALLAVPGVPHPEPAVACASDVSPAVRAAAARLLGREATPETLNVLETLASDPSARVRAAAKRSLAALRG